MPPRARRDRPRPSPRWAISAGVEQGHQVCVSSAPPTGMSTWPVAGSLACRRGRPQNSCGEAAFTTAGDLREVTGGATPKKPAAWYRPSAAWAATPAELRTSSAVPNTPSAPGAWPPAVPDAVRGSSPPLAGRWQVPQATGAGERELLVPEQRLAERDLALLSAFAAGTGGDPSGCGGGGGACAITAQGRPSRSTRGGATCWRSSVPRRMPPRRYREPGWRVNVQPCGRRGEFPRAGYQSAASVRPRLRPGGAVEVEVARAGRHAAHGIPVPVAPIGEVVEAEAEARRCRTPTRRRASQRVAGWRNSGLALASTRSTRRAR